MILGFIDTLFVGLVLDLFAIPELEKSRNSIISNADPHGQAEASNRVRILVRDQV